MRILLIKPYWPYPYSQDDHTYNRIWPPLSLLNCGALLEKKGHQVEVLDAHAKRLGPDQLFLERIKLFDKVFVTSSSLDRWQCPNLDISPFLKTVETLRNFTKEVYVMGYHGSVEPETILKQTKAKAVIRDEPEYTVEDICDNKNLSSIDGVTFYEKNILISTPKRPNFDITNLPVPAFHLLKGQKYSYEILGNKFMLFELSRGCKYSCKFCNRLMYGKKLRTKVISQIKKEISTAIEEQGVRSSYFMDLEFLSDKKVVNELCDFLIQKKYHFKWCCQTRADSITKDILVKMKKAGCRLIHLGLESGNQEHLDYSRKHLNIEEIKTTVTLCKNVKIDTLAFFIFGFKGETQQQRIRTFNFAKELNTTYVSFHKIHEYHASDMYLEKLKANKEINQFVKKIFIKYYIRLAYFRQMNIITFVRCWKLFFSRMRTLS